MFTNVARKETVLDEPIIVVANHVFESYSELSPFLSGMIDEKKKNKEKPQPIVIIGKQFSISFTAAITNVTKTLGLPILLLTCQGLKDEELMDLAEYTGGRYIDTHPKTGVKMMSYQYADAGMAAKLIAGPKQTAIVAGAGIATGQVSIRVVELKKLAETEQSPLYREELLRRAAGLDGGVATVYVDARNAVDRYYLKKKVEDAVNSCKAALEFGTLPGGGVAFLTVSMHMDPHSYLAQVLPVIHERVQRNAGGNLDVDCTQVRDAFYANKCALENAVAVVKILVTMEGVIVDAEQSLVEDLGKKLGYEG
jgi:chaperonin GroEL